MDTPAKAPQKNSYHHGQLREALLATTLQLVQEKGMHDWSLRDVARQLGVSAAAPFRHFDSKQALLAAVAEQAMQQFAAAVAQGMQAGADDPLRAMGHAYLHWAIGHPAAFTVISSRDVLNLAQQPALLAQSEAVMTQLEALLLQRFGQQPGFMVQPARLAFRAQVYGLARMVVDRHLEEWAIPPTQYLDECLAALDQFLLLLPGRAWPAGTV